MTDVAIRPYRPTDHTAGRRLWAELTEQHRELYADPVFGGPDAGAGFEEYLTRLDLTGVWVAESADTDSDSADSAVVGLVGLTVDGRGGRVEPVVVTAERRGQGIGRALLGHVADEARHRGLARLTVTPDARNVGALRCLRAAGYDVLSALQLTVDLRNREADWRDGVAVHGVEFRY